MTRAAVSVLVPVKNEEANLRRSLPALIWADEIFVVDSQSTDRTVEVAESFGAKVVQFHFNGTYPKKKNWALANLSFQNEWVLIVDADELVTDKLRDEIIEAITVSDKDGYFINFRYMFMGKWIKHCGYYPVSVLRIFKHRMGRYEKMPVKPGSDTGDNEAHEHVVFWGKTGRLKNDMLHYPYPNIAAWVDKHNRYSNWEAALYDSFLRPREGENAIGSRQRAKRTLKRLYLRIPFRYVLRFFYAYFLRLGFLDGRAGFIFCTLLAFYDFLSYAKARELSLIDATYDTNRQANWVQSPPPKRMHGASVGGTRFGNQAKYPAVKRTEV